MNFLKTYEPFTKQDNLNINFVKTEICEDVFVYKSIIPNINFVYRALKETQNNEVDSYLFSEWTNWGPYGLTSYFFSHSFEDCASLELLKLIYSHNLSANKNKDVYKKLLLQFSINTVLTEYSQMCIYDYIYNSGCNFLLPENMFYTRVDLGEYHMQPVELGHLEMPYHTDYVSADHFLSSDKFIVTCNTYLNDDYDGGEISFYLNGEIIDYKPNEGDIIVFPSGDPKYLNGKSYLHGVKKITRGQKNISRYYLKYKDMSHEQSVEGILSGNNAKKIEYYQSIRKKYGSVSYEELSAHKDGLINMFSFEEYYKNGEF